MRMLYHSIGQTELITLNRLRIGVNIVIIGMQLYFTADVFLDQFYIYLA